jgi:23S rRNA A2030 N6-methylase RlmJ
MAIVAVMQSKAQFNIDRARIIGEFALGDMTSENMQEINRRIAELEDNMQIPAQVQAVLNTHMNKKDRDPITVWNPETGKFEKQ